MKKVNIEVITEAVLTRLAGDRVKTGYLEIIDNWRT
jgi:hypothetical protein